MHDPYIILLGSLVAILAAIFMVVGGAELNFAEGTGFSKEMATVKGNRCEILIEEVGPHDIFKCGNLLGFKRKVIGAVKLADEFLRH